MSAPRIQGRRFLVFEFGNDDEIVGIPGMARAEILAQCHARNIPRAIVVPIDASEANRVARSPMARDGRLVVDESTVADFGRLIGVTPRHARRLITQIVAEGTGKIGRAMRRRLLDRDSESQSSTPPAGIEETLVDALSALLGPNGASLRDRPIDWPAVEAVALEIIHNVGEP